MTSPYTEEIYERHGTESKYIVRTFDENVDSEELIWHKDRQNRRIHILSGDNWYLQLDDQLPKVLEVGKEYYIPKETYHRVIKGEGNLVIRFPII
jgi:hypothetical protein